VAAFPQTNVSDPPSARTAWRERYETTRAQSLALAAPLSAEDQLLQSMPDASPTKWHLAHTTWFFEQFVLAPHAPWYAPHDPRFGYLFNSYYEALGARHPRPQRGLISRPSLNEVHAYRAHVDAAMARMIESADDAEWRSVQKLIELGFAHEQQHQELILMDIKHALSCNPLAPAYRPPPLRARAAAPPHHFIRFPGGLCAIGAKGDGFAFDNETPRHRVWLEPFKLAARLSTNAEYLSFIEDGGYARPELWLSDGWRAVQEEGWQAPLYWRGESDDRRVFTLHGETALDPSEPVAHVSYFEADAFARWAGKRLPREQEWEVAAAQASQRGHFAERGAFHPRPAESGGLAQVFGDLWEWTSSAYAAYPGFRTEAGALGEYNGKFMCGQFVLRGGSAITPDDHVRASYRNFFPPGARWAFSGIRLADDDT
jgi:ergothioneine biosynthesis protein EgtB